MTGGSVENQIQKLLNVSSADSANSAWPRMGRIPNRMHRVDDSKAYVPELVSIGPLPHSDPTLASMQKHKVRFFVNLSQQLFGSAVSIHDNVLKNAADKMVDKVRQSYSESFDTITDSDFSWIIALDACFILELFRQYHYHRLHGVTTTKKVEDEEIFRTRWILATLRTDLIKMENQLPYFVLQQFYDLTCTSSLQSEPTSLKEYITNFFAPLLPSANFIRNHHSQSSCSHAHLLSFLHSTLNPNKEGNNYIPLASAIISISTEDQMIEEFNQLPCASAMNRYGIMVRRREGALLDIRFAYSALKVTELAIDTDTFILLRNLLAHELCDTKLQSYIISYILFISQLISSPQDVQFFRRRKILTHSLLSDEQLVTELGNLAKEVAFAYHDLKNCYLRMVIKKINSIKGKQRNLFLDIIRERFGIGDPVNTFAILAIYVAVIQTIFTVLPYILRNSSQ